MATSDKQIDSPAAQQVHCADDAPVAKRINLGLTQASGEYAAWINAGDRYALDAIAVLVDRLQREPSCAVAYADFYSLREARLIAFSRTAEDARKLIRRDVVGPCFLLCRSLYDNLKLLDERTVLPVYDFWLRAHQTERLLPVRARLMYCWQPRGPSDDRAAERQTRHQWRKAQPLFKRTAGDIVDTAAVETVVVQPLLKLRRRLRGKR